MVRRAVTSHRLSAMDNSPHRACQRSPGSRAAREPRRAPPIAAASCRTTRSRIRCTPADRSARPRCAPRMRRTACCRPGCGAMPHAHTGRRTARAQYGRPGVGGFRARGSCAYEAHRACRGGRCGQVLPTWVSLPTAPRRSRSGGMTRPGDGARGRAHRRPGEGMVARASKPAAPRWRRGRPSRARPAPRPDRSARVNRGRESRWAALHRLPQGTGRLTT